MEEIRCRICDSELCLAAPANGEARRRALSGSFEVQLETDGTNQYFRCPYCSARNITIVTRTQNGQAAVQVAWAVMNGE